MSYNSPHQMATILIVDDTAADSLVMRGMLEGLGSVVEARTGQEALALLETQDFAVILLDVQMPGIDGLETARRIRANERYGHTPIIFVTANRVSPSELEEAYQTGGVDFLVKPLSASVLRAKVRVFLELFDAQRRESEQAEQLRTLIDSTKEYAIYLLDSGGYVITWNAGAERLKQYTSDEAIGLHFSRFYTPEAIAANWPSYGLESARLIGRFEDEGWRIRKDGTRFWADVVLTAIYDPGGQLRGFSKIVRDMTERRQADETARRLAAEAVARNVAEENAAVIHEHRERLRVTLESIGDGVITTDSDARVVFLNSVAEKLVGWELKDARNRPLTEVFRIVNEHTRQTVDNPAIRSLEEGAIVGLANHTILIARDGAEHPIDDSAAPIRDEDGNIIGSVLVFRDVTERKKAEAQLREQQSWLEVTLASIAEGVIATDLNGHVKFLNPVAQKLTGQDASTARGQPLDTVFRILDEHTRNLATSPVDQVLNAEANTQAFEHALLVDNEGTERHIDCSASQIRDTADEVQGVVLVFRDVTEQRRAAMDLQASEQRFRQLADALPQIVWTAKPDGAIDYLNKQWRAYTGLSETITNAGWSQVVHPDDARAAAARWTESLQRKVAFEMEVRLREFWSQAYRWHLIRTVPIYDESGRVTRWFGTSTDIHQQKRAAERSHYLAEASAALAEIVNLESTMQKIANLAVPYFADWAAVDVADADGKPIRLAVSHKDPEKIQLVHRLMEQYPPSLDAPTGVAAVIRTGRPEMVGEITDKMLSEGAVDERHLELIRSLGLKSYMCVPLNVKGKPFGALTFATAESSRVLTGDDLALAVDLANRAAVAVENTQLYESLREADKRKDEFLATLAHELRNPLAPIRNALHILQMRELDSETSQRAHDMLERQVHHLVRLVDDLLDMSRVMRGKIELRIEQTDLATVIARAIETVQPLLDAQKHSLHVDIQNVPMPLEADAVRLTQVVTNVLTNAAKYTDPRGQVWLSADRQDGEVVLRVRDNGIGIAPDMLSKVFDLFVQAEDSAVRSQGGLGIGLTLVKNLVERHHGTVTAHSEGVGKGSEFVIRLPLSLGESTVGLPEQTRPENERQATGSRLLIVDDNQDAANSLALVLKMRGHQTQVANSAKEALAIATTFVPDVVLLDIGMPEMDGYQAARLMRQLPGLENLVLVALTGWGQPADRLRSQEAGFDYHLVKPAELEELNELLARSRQRNST